MCSRPVRGSDAFPSVEMTRTHIAARRRGCCVAAPGARAAAGNQAPDRDLPSGNPDDAPHRNGWGERMACFFAELRRLGYIEGENLIIERAPSRTGTPLSVRPAACKQPPPRQGRGVAREQLESLQPP